MANFLTLILILTALYKIRKFIKGHPDLKQANFMICLHVSIFTSMEILGLTMSSIPIIIWFTDFWYDHVYFFVDFDYCLNIVTILLLGAILGLIAYLLI
jgi:hypothetical protein